jgi:hypothetical protein
MWVFHSETQIYWQLPPEPPTFILQYDIAQRIGKTARRLYV